MNSEQRYKIQCNFSVLVDGLLVDEITDNLYTESVIEHDDLQRVHAEKTDRDKARCLISILIATKNSYEPFVREVESSRPDLAEKLVNTDVGEEIKKGKEKRVQFLCDVLGKRYNFVKEKSVLEKDILREILLASWQSGDKYIEQDITSELTECIQKLFPAAIKVKSSKNKKKIWKYYNIERTEFETSDEDESLKDTESISAEENFDTGNISYGKPCSMKPLQDLKTSDLKFVLTPYCEKYGIDSKCLEVFDKEKIDGEVFSDCCMEDLNTLFADMPYGDKKRLLNIKSSILEEESRKGPFLEISSTDYTIMEDNESKQNRQTRGLSESDENDPETKFKEIFRTFDTRAKAADAYRRHAILRTGNLFISDLIEPLHCFRHKPDHDPSALMKWIAEETMRFACACFSDRTNGTIHFGISESCNEDGLLEGKVIGLQINQSKFIEVFYEEITPSIFTQFSFSVR